MKVTGLILGTIVFIGLLFLNVLGLMNLLPLYITSPLLFIAIFIILYIVNHRKTFKGF
ncbi:hypothetical protein JOC75_002042 [Metabacillus crassostreae]|uniref:hypothetical protein n=1 Tax=Metabacillus crassostreae TaxID=929098 RepID=UPI0019582C08|nr:hypothetical protein [Metabacillus crassostreae]MBM7604069.1 hypothetical protein [Metabacillus crassostreae]